MTSAPSPSAVLVRQSRLGGHDDPGPRPPLTVDPLLGRLRPLVMPWTSAMRAATDDLVVSLTYDDGPDPVHTAGILDALAERGHRATFFVLVDRARAHPALIRRMVTEGHEVGLHGLDHTRLTELSGRAALARVLEGRRQLERITHRPVTLYRPAYGAIGPTCLFGARRSGLDVVIWTAWAQDWTEAPAAEVAARAVRALHPGAIVLLHDVTDDESAAQAGPAPTFSRAEVTRLVLDGLTARGYTTSTVGSLFRDYPVVRALTVERPRLRLR